MTTTSIPSNYFVESLVTLLDETFDNVQGIYLDRGTSMFETLATISAEEASIPVGGQCATLAAQVKHVAFYLGVTEQYMRGTLPGRVDWGQIWRETSAVTPEEWEGLKQALRESYDRALALINEWPEWRSADDLTGAMGLVVHTAYHLGEIRQALCVLQPNR